MVDRLFTQITASLRRYAAQAHLRAEVAWVVGTKAAEFLIVFALLKLLTRGLGPAGYGEYNLAEALLVLLYSLFLAPMHESFNRDYQGARVRGDLRSGMGMLLRWYVVATGAVLALAALASPAVGRLLDLGPTTLLAAGLVFVCDRWRFLGTDYRNQRRNRRSWGVHLLGFYATQLAAIGAVLAWAPSPAHALFAYAAAGAVWALLGMPGVLRDRAALPRGPRSTILSLVGSYGVPLAALQLFQWGMGFADRYLLNAFLDTRTVGLYVAAYQVAGIPYSLLLRVCHEFVMPVAYQRAGDGSDPAKLWAADRAILATVALQAVVGLAMLALYAWQGTRLVVLLTTDEFTHSTVMVVTLAAGRYVQALSFAFQPIFFLHHRTASLLFFRILGSLLLVVACAYGILRYQALGAALGTLASGVVYLAWLVFGRGGAYWLARASREAANTSRSARTV